MIRKAFQKFQMQGHIDHATTPVYIEDIMAVIKAYSESNSREAGVRQLCILTLWQVY